MRLSHLPLDLRADGSVGFDRTHALRLLGDSKWARAGGRIASAITALSMANDLYNQVSHWRRQLADRHTYTITISSRDQLYASIHPWLLKQLPEPERKSLKAAWGYKSIKDASPLGDDEQDEQTVPSGMTGTIYYQYDGSREVDLDIGGCTVHVYIDHGEGLERDDDSMRGFRLREDRIVFTAKSLAAQQALMDRLGAVLDESRPKAKGAVPPPQVYRAKRYGDWGYSRTLQARDASTVVLADGLLDEIVAEVRAFMRNEKRYNALGLPYHWGCLLHGPPGSGKSTTVLQVARILNLPIYFVPLTDIANDTTLSELLEDLPERCVLLFEDVDYATATDAGRQDTERVSGEGLLQALDGAVTRHGQIVFMTTNRLEDLDPAVYRPGRCNKVAEIGYMTDEQLGGIVRAFTGRTDPLPPLGDRRIVPAAITTIIAQHIEDMDAAHAAIVRFLEAKDATTLELVA